MGSTTWSTWARRMASSTTGSASPGIRSRRGTSTGSATMRFGSRIGDARLRRVALVLGIFADCLLAQSTHGQARDPNQQGDEAAPSADLPPWTEPDDLPLPPWAK